MDGNGYKLPTCLHIKSVRVRIRVPFCTHGHGCRFDFVPTGKKFAGMKIPYPCPQTRLTCGSAAQVYKGLSRVPLILPRTAAISASYMLGRSVCAVLDLSLVLVEPYLFGSYSCY